MDIANEKEIEDGDTVTIFNDRGRLTGTVKILEKAHPKTINVDEGQWHKFGGSINLLTPDDHYDNGLGSVCFI